MSLLLYFIRTDPRTIRCADTALPRDISYPPLPTRRRPFVSRSRFLFATFAHGRTCFPAYFIRETIFLCVLES